MKSPITDRHSFKSLRVLKRLFPEKSIIESYLLYSGEIELELSSTNRMVIAHTNKYPVYEFWWMAKHRGRQVGAMANNIIPRMTSTSLEIFQDNWYTQRDPVYRAALFYLLNVCSSTSCASGGAIEKEQATPLRLQRFKKLDTTNFYIMLDKFEDFHLTINSQLNSHFKLFPIGNYRSNLLETGSKGAPDLTFVSHKKLWKRLEAADYKWVLLYKFHPHLLKLLDAYNIIMVDEKGNENINPSACEDLIVTNF